MKVTICYTAALGTDAVSAQFGAAPVYGVASVQDVISLPQDRATMLAAYGIMDTPAEAEFDDLVYLAADICEAPIALVSLVEDHRQWFKAKVGIDACETNINTSVCVHGLVSPDLLIIPDLKVDPRTAENPVVQARPPIRFYAGAPLRTSFGDTLGMLCVADHFPRQRGLTSRQERALRSLGRQATNTIELHRVIAERDARIAAMTH